MLWFNVFWCIIGMYTPVVLIKRGAEWGKKLMSLPCSHLAFFSPRSHVCRPPASSWNIKGPPLNCQTVLFSYKHSFCHLPSFYCLARQLTAQPRSLLLFPEPRMSAETAGEQLQQRKVILLCCWWPHYISNMDLHERSGRPKQRSVHLAHRRCLLTAFWAMWWSLMAFWRAMVPMSLWRSTAPVTALASASMTSEEH